MVTYAAPGKAILFGEHFVVYGARALIFAIDRHVTAQSQVRHDGMLQVRSKLQSATIPMDSPVPSIPRIIRPFHHIAASLDCGGATLELRSDIPVGAGLGSSSACCVAAAGALIRMCGVDVDILNVATAAERVLQPASSGADCAACTHGGVVSYVQGEEPRPEGATPADLRLVIADSGIKHNTPHMVESVRALADSNWRQFSSYVESADAICVRAQDSLAAGDIAGLGRLAIENQKLLEKIGVSSDAMRHMVQVADLHSYGSKITGAGGGGCIVAIADTSNAGRTVEALTSHGYNAFEAQAGRGARPLNNL